VIAKGDAEIGRAPLGGATAAPGTADALHYTVDGDTRVTIAIEDGAGAVVRTLASGVAVTAGSHSVSWNGTRAGGADVPDGSYRATVTSTDPAGNRSRASASVVIAPGPVCDAAQAGTAAAASALPALAAGARPSLFAGRPVDGATFQALYGAHAVLCAPLVGTGVDMVALYTQRARGAPPPAITPLAVFLPVSDRWTPAILQVDRIVTEVTLAGRRIVERVIGGSAGHPTDTRLYLYWDGLAFVTVPVGGQSRVARGPLARDP